MKDMDLGKPVELEIRYTDMAVEPELWYVNAIKDSGYFDYQQIDTKRWNYYGYYQPVAIVKVYWPYVMAGTIEDVTGSLKRHIIDKLDDMGCVERNDCGSRFYVPQKESEIGREPTPEQEARERKSRDDYER